MSNETKPTAALTTAIRALRSHLLEKGNRFERGPNYESQNSMASSVAEIVKRYEGRGYARYMLAGNPPVYAMLGRGREEVHIFQPQDPKVREWLDDEQKALNSPEVREYLLGSANLSESEIPVADKPQIFRITEVDGVFIISGENAAPERR
ncbi:MAG: hypothetical protein HC889_16425 [Synechococcaceae cyanobacterium SM1_2_3]|nr:hypothetical protein [Synechococcaceae cyanobacterium SM1_2_3]